MENVTKQDEVIEDAGRSDEIEEIEDNEESDQDEEQKVKKSFYIDPKGRNVIVVLFVCKNPIKLL